MSKLSNLKTDKYESNRRDAIRAAASVFATKGYHGASTADIAAELGIKQGSLYHYIKSKEEALYEVCLLGIEDYVSRMKSIASSRQSSEAKLLAVVTSHLASYREKNEAMKVHNDERLYLPKERRGELKRLGTLYRTLLEQILQLGIDEGTYRADIDIEFVAKTMIGVCNSWGHHLVRYPELDMFEVVQKCADYFVHGLIETMS